MKLRESNLDKLGRRVFDVLVIGGGINGVGTFRDTRALVETDIGPTEFAGVPALLLWVGYLLTAVLYLAINLLDGNVLTPRLQGSALSIHPVVVLVAVTVITAVIFGMDTLFGKAVFAVFGD